MAKATSPDNVKPQKASKSAKADKPNVFARLMQYFRDVRGEMKRVVWPGRQEVINSSIVVIVTLIFFTLLTLALDTVVLQVLDLIRRIG